jgi:hypothetical protein
MTRERLAGITEPVGAAFSADLNALRAAADPGRFGRIVCSADEPAMTGSSLFTRIKPSFALRPATSASAWKAAQYRFSESFSMFLWIVILAEGIILPQQLA